MNHIFHDREDGLHHCKVCNGAEGSLPTECPGVRMDDDQEDRVYAGNLDFISGMWVRGISDDDYECTAWFERDRANVALSINGREIFSLWDEDVFDAIESGYLTTPRLFGFNSRISNSDSAWQPHAVAYARSQGLIK